MQRLLATYLGMGLIGFTGLAMAETPNDVRIAGIDYRGSGCPAGTVAANISPDRKAMTVLFSDFIVESQTSRQVRKTCDVDVHLDVPPGWTYSLFCVDFRGYASLDEGFSGRQTAEYRFGRSRARQVGDLRLDGAFDNDYEQLTQIDTLSWAPCSGRRMPLTIRTAVAIEDERRGGTRVLWESRLPNRRNFLAAAERRCQRTAGCNGRKRFVRVGHGRYQCQCLGGGRRDPAAGGIMTVDSVDGELKHHYGIKWRRCRGGGGIGGGGGEPRGAVLFREIITRNNYRAVRGRCDALSTQCASQRTLMRTQRTRQGIELLCQCR